MKPPSEHYKRRKEWGDTRLAEEWTSVFSLAMPLSCFKNILLVSASNRHWFCFTCLHYSIQWFITKEQFNVFNSHGLHEHDASFRYQCDNYARLQRKCHELYHSPGITNFVLMFINLTWFKSYTYSLSLLVCVCKSQEGRKKKNLHLVVKLVVWRAPSTTTCVWLAWHWNGLDTSIPPPPTEKRIKEDSAMLPLHDLSPPNNNTLNYNSM